MADEPRVAREFRWYDNFAQPANFRNSVNTTIRLGSLKRKGTRMRNALLLAFLAIATSCGALAQDGLQPPKSVPLWVIIVAGDDGRIVMSFPDNEANKSENYTVSVPYQENGKMKFRVETRVRERKVGETRIPKTIRWRPNDIQFLDLNGNQLEPPEVASRIVKPTRMMAVTDPEIDPFFQAILKPETLVVVIPAKNLVGR